MKINKIENGCIFTQDFSPLVKNNEITFAVNEEIAVIYETKARQKGTRETKARQKGTRTFLSHTRYAAMPLYKSLRLF
jgi:hypothetical protein